MLKTLTTFVGLTLLAATCAASTSVTIPGSGVVLQESVDFIAVNGGLEIPSIDGLGDPDNIVLSTTLTGGYNLTGTTYSGTIRGEGNNWLGEASVSATHPMGTYALTSFPVASTSGPATTESFDEITGATGPFELDGGFDPAGLTTFEFYDTSVDNPDAADTTWEALTVEFWGEVTPTVTTITDGMFALGSLNGLFSDDTNSHVSGGLDFFEFTLDMDGTVDIWTDSSTNGAAGTSMTDTEIALFDSTDALIFSNDDGGPGCQFCSGLSALSLPAGDYTLVTSGFNSNLSGFGGLAVGDDIGLATAGTNTGDYELNIDVTLVPEPSGILILLTCLGGLFISRR
jgi:hypothetical protein